MQNKKGLRYSTLLHGALLLLVVFGLPVAPVWSAPQNSPAPIEMSDINNIRNQLFRNWAIPAGSIDAHNLAVTLSLELDKNGNVLKVELAKDQARFNSDPEFNAVAQSAIRAVKMASPLQNLPSGKYYIWRKMVIRFDPKDAL